jgi:hypothetical protein
MTEKKLNFEKKILIAEAIFIFGALVYLYFSMGPSAISPISGQTILDPDFVFEVENGEEVLISINEQFTNPIILREDSEVDLPPGTYYWKVRNWLRESEIHTFTIQSNVGLNLREGKEKDVLENAGNVPVDVKEKKSGITSGIGVGESAEVEKNGEFEGTQNG